MERRRRGERGEEERGREGEEGREEGGGGAFGGKPYNRAPRHISKAFCRLGFPCGSRPTHSLSFSRWSAGFPPMSLTLTAMPSRMARTAICEMGFCSKYSLTNRVA